MNGFHHNFQSRFPKVCGLRRSSVWFTAVLLAGLLSAPRGGWALTFNASTPSNMVARFQAGTYPANPIPNADPSFIGLGYDWSGVGWMTSDPTHSAGLLSPRTVLQANHWQATNLVVQGSGGRLITNTFSTVDVSIASDLGIGTLSAPIPLSAGVAYYPLIDLGAAANWSGLNALRYGWVAQVGTNSISSVASDFSTVWFNWSTNNPGEAGVISGDSCSPDFLSYANPLTGSNQLAVIGAHYFANSNPLPNGYWSQIDTEMAKTGYSLHWVAPTNQAWTGGAASGAYTNAGNWSSAAPGTNDTVLFNAVTANGQYLINLASNQMLNGIMIHAGNGNGFAFTNGVLALGKVGIVNGDTATNVFAAPIAFNAPQNWDSGPGGLVFNGSVTNNGYLLSVEGAGTTLINGAIAGSGGLAKDGTGTLVIGNSNVFHGVTYFHNGVVDMANNAVSFAGLNGEAGTVQNFSQLMVGSNGLSTTYAGVLAGTGSVVVVANGTLTLSGNNTYSGGSVVSNGTLAISSDANLGAAPSSFVTNSIVLASSASYLVTSSNFTLNSNRGIVLGLPGVSGGGGAITVNGGTLTYGGVIADNGSGNHDLLKWGLGTLVLSGANTWRGNTMLNAGTIQLGASNALPVGVIWLSGGILDLGGFDQTVGGLYGSGGIVTNGGVSGTLKVSAGSFNGSLYIPHLAKVGAGSWTLAAGVVNKSLITEISAGTLIINSVSNLDATTTLTNGATLRAASNVALDGGRNFILYGNGGFMDTDTNTLTISGAISGAGGITKIGAGTLLLSGISNTYTGATLANAGTVALSGNASLASSLWVSNGAAFRVSNSVSQISGVVTNMGVMTTMGSRVTYGAPVVIGGGYVSDPSTNIFSTNTTVLASGYLSGSTGDVFQFNGNLTLQSTNSTLFNLMGATMLFTNGVGQHVFDVTGSSALDHGSNFLHFTDITNNFGIGVLQLAPSDTLHLAGASTNALYVGILDVGGTTNNLANLAMDFNVYYDSSLLNNAYLQDRTYQLGAGFLIPIPEPSTWLMMLLGILMTVLLRRKEGRFMRPDSSPVISMSPRGDP